MSGFELLSMSNTANTSRPVVTIPLLESGPVPYHEDLDIMAGSWLEGKTASILNRTLMNISYYTWLDGGLL